MTEDDLHIKVVLNKTFSILIQVLFYALQFLSFYVALKRCKSIVDIMIKFHDYLIAYRLTPRSRIIRKHLPKLSMVLEEESNMDQSSMMLSQSAYGQSTRLYQSYSVSHASQTQKRPKRKFHYREDAEDGTTAFENNSIDSSSSSSDDVLFDEQEGDSNDDNLEKDLSVFDDDQAEIIRNINKESNRVMRSSLDYQNANQLQ